VSEHTSALVENTACSKTWRWRQ